MTSRGNMQTFHSFKSKRTAFRYVHVKILCNLITGRVSVGKSSTALFCFLLVFQFPACPFLTFLPSLLLSSFFPLLPPPSLLPLLLFSKTIKVKIIDDEEYEKNKTFYIEIGEPRLVESNDTKGQEEGEPRDPANSEALTPECPSHCRGRMFLTHGGTQEGIYCSPAVVS